MKTIPQTPITKQTLPLAKSEFEVVLAKKLPVKSFRITTADGRKILFLREVRNEG